jgi:hypothetical protein
MMMAKLGCSRALRSISCSMLVLACGSASALADGPAALDRVPANAAVSITVRNIDQFTTRMTALTEQMGLPDADGPLEDITKLLATPGLNKAGSAAMIVLPGADGKLVDPEDGSDPAGVVLVPVSDYAAFVKALGATSSDGVQQVEVDGIENFVRDGGGGYAIVGRDRELVGAFKNEGGNAAAHMKLLGAGGRRTADAADILIIASISAIGEQLKGAGEGFAEQAAMMAQMAGGGGLGAQAEVGELVINTFARDGQVGIVGVGLGEKGVWLDIGAQFKEGSELAGFFSAAGKSGALLSRVPSMPFLFAGSMDLSAPGVKKIVKNLNEINAKAAAQAAKDAGEEALAIDPTASFTGDVDDTQGMSFVLGASPGGLMGGLLVNTVAFIESKNPAKYLASAKDNAAKVNGQTVGGVTMKSTYESGAVEISGVKVDKWTTETQTDPDDPNAGSIQMAQAMMFGQGPAGGFMAATENGVVMTLSQNTSLMTKALAAAKGENNAASDAALKEAQAVLPEGRTFEFFVGSKSLMDTVGGLMAMMGGGEEMNFPEKLSHIAIGGTTDGGGVSTRIYLPADVLKAIAEVTKGMAPPADGEDGDGGGEPTF